MIIRHNPNVSGLMSKQRSVRNSSNMANLTFRAKEQAKKDSPEYKNPIIPGFEYLDATKATLIAGFYVAARVFFEFADNLDVSDALSSSKNSKSSRGLKFLAAGSLAIGATYFALNLPKNLYNKKVEVFKKTKEMDVYTRANSAEKNLYERIDSETTEADNEKKTQLATDYLKLKMAKNKAPDFIQQY